MMMTTLNLHLNVGCLIGEPAFLQVKLWFRPKPAAMLNPLVEDFGQ